MRILVSNSAQTADDSANTSGNDHAQLFHAGANAGGYTLTQVVVNSEDNEGDDFDVEVCEEDGTTNEFPSTTAGDCTALTAPASFTAGNLFFDHTGLALSANTNYVVVIKQRGTGSVELNTTTSGGEDTSLGLSDWSIKDKFYWKSGSTWMLKSGSNEALRIIVRGYAVTVDATDATLSPAFDAATTTYSATVANAVNQVTITETTSEPTATVEYLDGSDNTLTDADTMTAGLQVNLSVGSNIVKVKVTAPNGTTTKTYTVNVLRGAVPATCSVASMQNRIWTANLTVGTRMVASVTFYGWADGLLPYTGASLTDDEFTFGGNTYDISLINLDGTALSLEFDGANAGDIATQATRNTLTLHVGSDSFNLGAGTLASNQRSIGWSNTGLSWAASDSVCLALTVAGPAVSSVELTSDPGTDNTYKIGDAVEATVAFSAGVDITGTPQLELDFAGTPKAAACTAATNTTTMACYYTVVVNDTAPNGIAIAANKLTLNGGTITATGSTTINAVLAHAAVAIDANHKVDGIRPTLVTTGSEAPTTSTDGTQVILTFSEDISAADRTKITIGIGGGNVAVTSGARVAGTTVELDLSTFIDATVMLTVAIDADDVEDGASNGNLAVAATPVTNAITANASPVFSAATATRSVAENSPASTHVGAPVTATDEDNDPLTYTLEGTAATAFEIVSTCGQIRTTAGETYDRETQSSYAVTVKADDDNGGTDTIAVTITLTNVIEPPGRPAAPSVSSVAGSTTSLSVMWTAPSNTGPAIDNYDLRYREGTGGSWINGPQNVSGTNATISGLTANTLYQVQVQATSGEGDSPWSPPGSGQTGALGAPDVPHSLDATPGNRQVMLSWVQPSGGAEVTHYEYELDGSGTWISTGSTDTDYTVRNLTNGQPYTFKVRAANSAGQSAASTASASVTPATVPGAPSSLSATVSDQRVDLIWTAPASNGGATILRYEYELDFSGTWTSTGGTATSYTVTGLANGQSYTFRVRAVNSVGAGAASGSRTATPSPSTGGGDDEPREPPPDAPEDDGGFAITGYEYRIDQRGDWISIGSTDTTHTVTGLVNGTEYVFEVRAVTAAGSSAPSNRVEATPRAAVTLLVANFSNGNNGAFNSRVYLWNPSASAGQVTVRVFTLPLTTGIAQELTGPPLDLGTLEARSALNLKLVEDILDPLGIALPYTTDGGNLTLEFTIQAVDVRGAAQVFSSDFAFGTYPLQEIPSTSSGSPTVLVANFTNGNNGALHSRVYLWNPSASAGEVTVRVFTLPRTGDSSLLGTLDLESLQAESARNLKLVEDILTPLGIPTPYVTDGGNLTLEFTIQAADVRGAAQVFSSSFAFGTVPLQVIR